MMKKSEMKKMYETRKNIANVLKRDNDMTEKNIDIYMTFCNISFENEELTPYENIIDFIAYNDIHTRYTISIIKSIAGNPAHFCNNSCMDIVNSGYTQTIFDDIKQEVFLCLFDMVENNNVTMKDNKLVFNTYINSNDKETSYFVKLYRVVENFFYSEKKQSESRYTKIKYDVNKHGTRAHVDEKGYLCDKFGNAYLKGCKMEYLDSYNDDVTSINASSYKEFLYSTQQENGLQNATFRKDIKSFFRIIKAKYPKYYSDFCGIFQGLYQGYSYKEIAVAMNTTERRIKYLIPLFREKYTEIMVNGIDLDKEKYISMYGDVTRNHGGINYINRENNKDMYFISVNGIEKYMIVPRVKQYNKVTILYKEPLHKANYDYDVPQYEIERMNKEKEEKARAIDERTKKYINVLDNKKKRLLVINESGDTLYTIPLKYHGKENIEKWAKENSIDIL